MSGGGKLMARIFMDVGGMRRVARDMRSIAETHEHRINMLNDLLDRLQELWIGHSPEQYVALQKRSLELLRRKVLRINELARQLEYEISRYESMDHLDGGASESGGW